MAAECKKINVPSIVCLYKTCNSSEIRNSVIYFASCTVYVPRRRFLIKKPNSAIRVCVYRVEQAQSVTKPAALFEFHVSFIKHDFFS